MELKDQVVSLEYAKKLKELGIEQISLFWRHRSWNNEKKIENVPYILYQPDNTSYATDYSTFTVAELGKLLIETTNKIDCGDCCYDHSFENEKPTLSWADNHYVIGENEADVRAKMLIYLLENKLLTK